MAGRAASTRRAGSSSRFRTGATAVRKYGTGCWPAELHTRAARPRLRPRAEGRQAARAERRRGPGRRRVRRDLGLPVCRQADMDGPAPAAPPPGTSCSAKLRSPSRARRVPGRHVLRQYRAALQRQGETLGHASLGEPQAAARGERLPVPPSPGARRVRVRARTDPEGRTARLPAGGCGRGAGRRGYPVRPPLAWGNARRASPPAADAEDISAGMRSSPRPWRRPHAPAIVAAGLILYAVMAPPPLEAPQVGQRHGGTGCPVGADASGIHDLPRSTRGAGRRNTQGG